VPEVDVVVAVTQSRSGRVSDRRVTVARALQQRLITECGVLRAGAVGIKCVVAIGGVEAARGVGEERVGAARTVVVAVVLARRAPAPMPVLSLAVVFWLSVTRPVAVFRLPVVLFSSA
jgi:hypothetical protein